MENENYCSPNDNLLAENPPLQQDRSGPSLCILCIMIIFQCQKSDFLKDKCLKMLQL